MSGRMPTRFSYELDEYNSRIKVLDYDAEHTGSLMEYLGELAKESGLGKVIVYAKPEELSLFEELGFEKEGEITGFFDGNSACVVSKFIHAKRSIATDEHKKNGIVQLAEEMDPLDSPPVLKGPYHVCRAEVEDVEQLSRLYKEVFLTYPTPIGEEEFLKECMDNDVYFSVVKHDDKIISAASADVFKELNCAEITDCATYPAYRGKGLLSSIIFDLEKRIKNQVDNLFSFTRSVSTGMNIVISRLGYEYKGRLVQNSQINGRYEDLNIWVKSLADN